MKPIAYTKIASALIFGSAIFVVGCSQDTSTAATDTTANEETEVSAKAVVPTEYYDEPTIEITGKASYDIWALNNQVNSVNGKKVFAKTASSVLVDNLGMDGPYNAFAKRLLEKGEKSVDSYLDNYSAGLWSIVKLSLLD